MQGKESQIFRSVLPWSLGMLLAPNIDVLIGMRMLLTANSRAKINHETEGFVKILADANHPLVTLAETMDSGADKAAELASK